MALNRGSGVDEAPYPTRAMPRFWHNHSNLFGLTCVATMALILWTDSSWYAVLPFVVGPLLTLHMRRYVRCPRCDRRLPARLVDVTDTRFSLRYFYDCPNCQTTWDPQFIERSD
jgi:hypothetical protein